MDMIVMCHASPGSQDTCAVKKSLLNKQGQSRGTESTSIASETETGNGKWEVYSIS